MSFATASSRFQHILTSSHRCYYTPFILKNNGRRALIIPTSLPTTQKKNIHLMVASSNCTATTTTTSNQILRQQHFYSISTLPIPSLFSSPLPSFSSAPHLPSKRTKTSFIPRKAPVKLTPKARQFFKALLQNKIESDDSKNVIGILLSYQHSQSGQLRMAFTFDFVTVDQLGRKDEPVSLEVVQKAQTRDNKQGEEEEEIEEIPKSPEESLNDGLPKLYIHEHAFMKVLGCTIDIDMETFTPILYDREGNLMDPNA